METIPLNQLNCGAEAKIEKIFAGYSATKRLYEMGLNTGAQVQVVKNDKGPIILSLCGNKIAIGRGLAKKVMVKK